MTEPTLNYLEVRGNVGECCATLVIGGFPHNAEFKYDRTAEETFRREIENAILLTKQMRKSLLVATVNSAQTRAAEIMKDMGFWDTPWVAREQYGEYTTRVKILTKQVTDEVYDYV